MATKAKESMVVKEKKASSSSNSATTTTKKSTKPTSSTTTTSPKDKATTTSNPTTTTEKQVPNYLKPTISSRLVESNSFKLTRNDVSNKPNLNRRRSFDKPPSPSRVPKQTHPSPPFSRQHKALVSPGPRERSQSLPFKTTNSSKPIPQRLSKTPKEGKTTHQPALFAKSDKKSRGPSPSTSTTPNKVPKDESSESTKDTKSTDAETTTEEVTNIETETEAKEAIGEKDEVEEVEKVEKLEQEIEHKAESEDSPHVESEHDYENDHEVEESDESHVQADQDRNLIPTMPEVEAAKEENHDGENINQEECNKVNETISELNHSTTEEEVEVGEKEEEEGVEIIEEEEKSDEEGVMEEEKEGVEGGIIEEEVNVEKEEEEEEEKGKCEESRESKEEVQHGKKESQVSNDVIEETASKLLEERKNKVRALAGAFQTVIDYQTK